MGGERKIGRSFCEHVDQAEAQAEIGRLLTDSRFQSPERNRNFLRFIATEFFEGRAEAIKAYAIAVDVFGRPANFDPSVDPIVRIEATRLRAALTQYYDAHGSDTGIRVDLPRGRYVPVFTRMVPNDMPPPGGRSHRAGWAGSGCERGREFRQAVLASQQEARLGLVAGRYRPCHICADNRS